MDHPNEGLVMHLQIKAHAWSVQLILSTRSSRPRLLLFDEQRQRRFLLSSKYLRKALIFMFTVRDLVNMLCRDHCS